MKKHRRLLFLLAAIALGLVIFAVAYPMVAGGAAAGGALSGY
jgi:hypothetical protein